MQRQTVRGVTGLGIEIGEDLKSEDICVLKFEVLFLIGGLELFSIECCKTKTKPITGVLIPGANLDTEMTVVVFVALYGATHQVHSDLG